MVLANGPKELHDFASKIRKCMHAAFVNGLGTRDLAGPTGLTTENVIDYLSTVCVCVFVCVCVCVRARVL